MVVGSNMVVTLIFTSYYPAKRLLLITYNKR